MTVVFSIAVAVGCIALLVWIILVAAANVGAGNPGIDPERWAGGRGRVGVAAILGFGLAGISASYGGWATLPSVLASILGAVGLGAVAIWLGPEPEG